VKRRHSRNWVGSSHVFPHLTMATNRVADTGWRSDRKLSGRVFRASLERVLSWSRSSVSFSLRLPILVLLSSLFLEYNNKHTLARSDLGTFLSFCICFRLTIFSVILSFFSVGMIPDSKYVYHMRFAWKTLRIGVIQVNSNSSEDLEDFSAVYMKTTLPTKTAMLKSKCFHCNAHELDDPVLVRFSRTHSIVRPSSLAETRWFGAHGHRVRIERLPGGHSTSMYHLPTLHMVRVLLQ
jgi:hypothetical protein